MFILRDLSRLFRPKEGSTLREETKNHEGYQSLASMGVPAPLKPWGNVLVVEYPYKAFEIIITIKVDGKKPIKKTRGTYIKEWAAENRGKELKREAYKRGFHEIEAQNCLWAVQKDSSYVVECSLNELIIKKASQYNDDNDRKYKEVDFDEEVVEYDVDDLTG